MGIMQFDFWFRFANDAKNEPRKLLTNSSYTFSVHWAIYCLSVISHNNIIISVYELFLPGPCEGNYENKFHYECV